MNDGSNDNVVDMSAARNRLDPVRKEKAAKELRKQFQKAMGWKNTPKSKKPDGKGPLGGGPGNGPRGGKRKKK